MNLAAAIWDHWEDYQHGMYAPAVTPEHVAESVRLLSDPAHFHEVATELLRAWPNSARQNLTYMWTGRNAWVGQAACCYAHGATGAATRQAWGALTNTEQREANEVARGVRQRWERGERDAQTVLEL